MKVVILAGGFGTRISEESVTIPKPLVEIGDMPILWHIMKIYSAHGLNEFVICCGYKGHLIKNYFLDFFHRNADFTIDLAEQRHRRSIATAREHWKVTLVDTGLETMTGGRLKRVREHTWRRAFCLTYGDGVSDVDISDLIAFHHAQGTLATVTAVQQPGRFGALNLSPDRTRVNGFREKSAQRRASDQRRLLRAGAEGHRLHRRTTRRSSSRAAARPGRAQTSSRSTIIRATGRTWTPCATSTCCRACGKSGKAPWKIWDRPAELPAVAARLAAIG